MLGEFNEDIGNFEGLFKLVDEERNIECLATMKNFKKNGEGVFKFPNGDLYVGNFEDGEMSGKGVYYYMDGSILEGDVFMGDKLVGRHGKLTWIEKGKSVVYSGSIKDGIPHGKGRYFFEKIKELMRRKMEIFMKENSKWEKSKEKVRMKIIEKIREMYSC